MDYYQALLLIAALFPLFIFVDYKSQIKAASELSGDFDVNERLSTAGLAFSPFVLLFYTDDIWVNSLYLIPLYAFFSLLMYIANKNAWCAFFTSDIYINAGSGIMVMFICYFIFFHEGVFNEARIEASIEDTSYPVWPYYLAVITAGVGVSVVLLRKFLKLKPGVFSFVLVIMSIVFPLLPLFIQSYWWGMFASMIAMFIFAPVMLAGMDETARGGVGFVFAYLFMMVSMLSLLLYAFLF